MAEETVAPGLSPHEADSIESLAAFHLEHYRQSSRLQSAIDRLTGHIGRPLFVVGALAAVLIWTALAGQGGTEAIGSPALAWVAYAGTMAALIVSLLILATQRREDELAERRAKLTLELALLADKKTSKLIALLEELRRDQPEVANRIDPETEAMAKAADPKVALEAIEEQAGRPG